MADPRPVDTARISELERRLSGDPGSRAFVELARLYHEEGRHEEAARLCADGVRRNPGYLSARVLLGRIYFDMGFLEEARETMEYVLERAPDNLVARKVIAECFLAAGDRDAALERYRALLAFKPEDTEARSRIAEIERLPARAAPRPPDGRSSLATPTLAEIYLQQGMPEEAARLYTEILAADPDNAEIRERLASIGRGEVPAIDPQRRNRLLKIEALTRWLEAIRAG